MHGSSVKLTKSVGSSSRIPAHLFQALRRPTFHKSLELRIRGFHLGFSVSSIGRRPSKGVIYAEILTRRDRKNNALCFSDENVINTEIPTALSGMSCAP